MWIRLLLLVTVAVGLNWVISMEIKKQQQQVCAAEKNISEPKKFYTYAHIPSAKQRASGTT